MNGKTTIATCLLASVLIPLSVHMNADETNLDEGEYTAFTEFEDVTAFGGGNARTVPPLVIMADDPAYERFRREYQAQDSSKKDPEISEALKIERTVYIASPQAPQQQKNSSQFFVFQNITEGTNQEIEPSVDLMEFRRQQIENLRSAARKKSQ